MSLFGGDRPFGALSATELMQKYAALQARCGLRIDNHFNGDPNGLWLIAQAENEADQLMDLAAVTFADTQGIAPALTAYILGIGSAYR